MDGGAGDDVYHVDADDQVVDSDASLDDEIVAGGSYDLTGTIAELGGYTLDGFVAGDSIEITDLGADPQIDVIGANTGITFAGGGTLMINGFSGTLEREGNVLKVAPQVGDPINPDVMTGTLGNDTI